MTGLCGIRTFDGAKPEPEACARMRQELEIYGPHGSGQWDGDGISLGIRKFRTVPEDRFDRQPLEDDRFCMVADIRLDNRPELTKEFGWTEAEAASRADADFAFAAWKKWGTDSLDKLIGDWAIAVWDKTARTLTLARDYLGQRPLFWHSGTDETGKRFFAFASMTKGLFALPAIKMAPDANTLKFYLTLAPMRGPGWFFKDISRVLPGGMTVLHADGSVESREWYDWSALTEKPVDDDDACVREFRALFDRAVDDRLRATGGIASHLSSGFDSSSVATAAALQLAKTGKRLDAYTHVPRKGWQQYVEADKTADEGAVATITAAAYPNIDHHLVDSGDREIGADLAGTFYYAQIPVLNLCNQVWGCEIRRQAAQNGASVLLNGGMGNMTVSQRGVEKQHDDFRHGRFLTWWRDARMLRTHGMRLRGSVYRSIAPWFPKSLNTLILQITGRSPHKITRYSSLKPDIAHGSAFQAELRALHYDPTFRPHTSVRKMAEFVLRRLDIGSVMQKAHLAQYGIDDRDPTSDRRLMEFSLTLPPRMWLRNGEMKWLYRQAFGERVPDAVLTLKKKGRQGADWPERMRRSWNTLKMELAPVLDDPMVNTLMDTGFLRKIADRPLPESIDDAVTIRYRIKFLRGLSVAHFIRKAEMRN